MTATPDPLPFDRFTLGEALSLLPISFILVYVFILEKGANERFDRALNAFGGALGNS